MNRTSSKHYRFRTPSMYAIRPTVGKEGQQRGWQVAFVRDRQRYEKHFANSNHGGKAQALAAAKAWRDETSRSIPCVTKAALSELKRRHNTSGYPGVYLMATKRKTANGVRTHWMWQARTPEEAKPVRTRSFSIGRYGNDEAFARAVAARQEFVRELAGQQWSKAIPKEVRPQTANRANQ